MLVSTGRSHWLHKKDAWLLNRISGRNKRVIIKENFGK